MDNSLIPADEDHGVWDELHHQQSREIQQHLDQTQSFTSNMFHQTVHSIVSATERAAVSFQYKPIVNESPNLSDFGFFHDEPLLQGFESGDGYQEFPHNNTPQRNGFVLLQNFRLPRAQEDAWGAVSNLDLFFSSLYNYYYQRGLTPILGKGIADLVSLFLTLWLSVVLFAFVDWQALSKCTDEQSCRPRFGDYMIKKPFAHFSVWNSIVILYCILFTAYGLFSVWSFWRTIQDALKTKRFFEDRLGISEQRLEGGAVDWDRDVVTKLIKLQENGDYQITIHGQGKLDALVIAQRILRKDNFMVAFFNRGLLDLHLPLIPHVIYCKSLEWAIYFCVLNYMFNHKFQIRPGFYLDPQSLRRRFFLCGMAHVVFLPFLAFFMILHFLMQNGYDWKARKQYLGPKEWSLAARWTFREFNELPHFLERRLGPSYEATEEYLKLFRQSEVTTTFGRILSFIGGAFAAVLFGFAAVNDAILLHVKIGKFNLLWFVAVATMCYSAGKAMLPDPDTHTRYIWNLNEEMDRALTLIASHTHHYPDTWKRKGYDMKTMSIVKSLFTNKTTIFIHEMISLVLAPLILCYSLPRCSEYLCEFVMSITAEVPGAGDLCGYTTFDFDGFGDDSFEGKTMGEARGNVAASVAELQNVEAATRLHPKPKAYHGKMEKSFFTFKACHPSWISTKSGQTLIDRVEQFKEVESKLLALEQKQHLEAAVRQLETLARMQQRTLSESPVLGALRESNISGHSPHTSGADSGGGGAALPNIDGVEQRPPLEVTDESLTSPQLVPPLINPPRNRQITPPPFSLYDPVGGMSSAGRQGARSQVSGNQFAQSVLHYNDLGLSTDLRRMLSHSSFDPEISTTNRAIGAYDQSLLSHPSLGRDPDSQQRIAEQTQYVWLQRYHQRLSENRAQSQATVHSVTLERGESTPNDAPVNHG